MTWSRPGEYIAYTNKQTIMGFTRDGAYAVIEQERIRKLSQGVLLWDGSSGLSKRPTRTGALHPDALVAMQAIIMFRARLEWIPKIWEWDITRNMVSYRTARSDDIFTMSIRGDASDGFTPRQESGVEGGGE